MSKYLMAIAALSVVMAGCNDPSSTTPPAGETPPSSTPTGEVKTEEPKTQETPKSTGVGESSELRDAVPLKGEEVAVIDTKMGRIVFRFFADKAPNHVENFKKLANSGFYNGTTFHRVIPGFMIQGGDPNTKNQTKSDDGQGGPGYNINAEFNEIAHTRGIVSMARSSDPNSAGSQFFICQANSANVSNLDTQYTVWGQVVKSGKEAEGKPSEYLPVVDKIVNAPRDTADNPKERIEMKVSIQKWPLK